MDIVRDGAILMGALGLLARDPQSSIESALREEIQMRLRGVHAMGIPLVLSPSERLRYREPLLAYLKEHRPRIMETVATVLEEY